MENKNFKIKQVVSEMMKVEQKYNECMLVHKSYIEKIKNCFKENEFYEAAFYGELAVQKISECNKFLAIQNEYLSNEYTKILQSKFTH